MTGVGVEPEALLADRFGPWTWSPDGRSILFVECVPPPRNTSDCREDGARMFVVDVETGVATPLPFRVTRPT